MRLFKLSDDLVRLYRDRRGNIGMIFALMSGVLFLLVGGALDYSRWNAVRTDVLESMDAASLAVAKLYEDDETLTATEIDSIGYQFFLENANYEDSMLPGWSLDFDVKSSGNIRTCIDGKIKTFLLAVVEIAKLDVKKCVEITPQGSGRIELALVLDVTGSMNQNDDSGAHKMTSLKSAVDELLDVLYDPGETTSDNVRLGVVPFNQYVNAGGASSWDNANWGDVNAQSLYHGARFFHVDSTGNIDMTRKVNHYDLYNSDPDSAWGGCVEARPYPLDELDTPPGGAISSSVITEALQTPTYDDEPNDDVRDAFTNRPDLQTGLTATMLASAGNSRWVPSFIADEPDCGASEDCEGSDYNSSDTGWVNGWQWYGYWFDDPDNDSVLTWVKENNYEKRQYIQDRRYTNKNQGTPFEKYVPVVGYFRDVMSGATSDPLFEAWLNRYGAFSAGRQEYIARVGYPGWWDPVTSTYKGKYDLPKWKSWITPNPTNCPPPLTPLTDDRTIIEDAVDALSPNGFTNVPIGAVWGWRVVSPGAPFEEAIGPGETGVDNTTETDWQKAVLIMSDGDNVYGHVDTHFGSRVSANGYEIESRMGKGVNRANGGKGHHTSIHAGSTSHMQAEADNKLLRICRRMKQDNILVYAIVFDVGSGSRIETVMKSCASEPGAPFFYNAADGADLEEAFGLIAEDLVKLHVSE